MRITQQILNQTAIEGMQANLRRLAETQTQAVTTKRISRPEDDPFAVEQALGFRANLKAGEALLGNITLSSAWLHATDQALSDINTLLVRTQDLALRGANEALGPDGRQALASEVEGMLEQAVALSNTRHGNHYIFAGFQVDQPAFSVSRDAATGMITSASYEGDNGLILRQVEPGATMAINLSGNDLFDNVFNTLTNLRDSLRASPFVVGDVSTQITGVQNQMNNLADLQAALGAKARRLEMTASRIEAAQTGLTKLLSETEDADMAEVISQLNQQQFAYQAALSVNARTLQLSLLDFLR